MAAVATRSPRKLLTLTDGARVVGFAFVGTEDDPMILSPVALRAAGRIGRAFMLAVMRHLRGEGIDWTGNAPFYKRLGFRVWATYIHFRRS